MGQKLFPQHLGESDIWEIIVIITICGIMIIIAVTDYWVPVSYCSKQHYMGGTILFPVYVEGIDAERLW